MATSTSWAVIMPKSPGRFGGVYKIGWRAGAGEGGGELAADVPRFADAGDDDSTLRGEDQIDGGDKAGIQLFG